LTQNRKGLTVQKSRKDLRKIDFVLLKKSAVDVGNRLKRIVQQRDPRRGFPTIPGIP